MLELAPKRRAAARAKFDGPGTAATDGRAARARHPARRMRAAGAAARDQRRHHPPARPPRRRRRGRGRAPAAAARSSITWARRTRRIAFAKAQRRCLVEGHRARGPVDAIIINASGCGTTVKDYGHLLAPRAAAMRSAPRRSRPGAGRHRVPGRARPRSAEALVVAARRLSLGLLDAARPAHHRRAEGAAAQGRLHAWSTCRKGTSAAARPASTTSCSRRSPASCATRKVGNIESVRPDIVAAGNIGCITQIGLGTRLPIVHTVELLDWAYGGPVPRGLESFTGFVSDVPGHAAA